VTDAAEIRTAIERRAFAGWRGLAQALAPRDLFPELEVVEHWGRRSLGDEFAPADFTVLELPGYYRPTISVRDDVVLLFDGMNPELEDGLGPLSAELGEPAALLDYGHGTLPVKAGEWPYPERGITLFVNTTADRVLHIALYAPTTLDVYLRRLRPHLSKKRRPLRTPEA
jgi:hypothetical protein